jgi:hypothetical protein
MDMNPDEMCDVLRAVHSCATRRRAPGRSYGPQGVALWQSVLEVVEHGPDEPFLNAWDLLVDRARGYLAIPEADEGGEG